MHRPGFVLTALVAFGLSMTTARAGERQLGQWTYYSDFNNTRSGAAVYPGQGRINLLITCPQATLGAVSITVDNGLFETGTVLVEWDGSGEVQFYDARVLADGRSLGLASSEFISDLRTRTRLNIGVYIRPNAESVVESVSLRGSSGAIRQLQCIR